MPLSTTRLLKLFGYAIALMVFVLLRWTHIEAMLASPVAQIPIIDSRYYLEWGQRVASGFGLGPHPFFMSPLYPLFIAFAGSIGDGFTASTLHLQLFLSAVTMLLLARFTARRVPHWSAGPLSALLFAVYAPAIFYDGVLLSASVILFLTTVALTLLDGRYAPGSANPGYANPASGVAGLRWWRMAGAGIAIGLSALARPNALILVPAFGAVFLWQAWREKRRPAPDIHVGDSEAVNEPRVQASTGLVKSVPGSANPGYTAGLRRGKQNPASGVAGLRKAWIQVAVLFVATLLVVLPAMWRNVRLGGEFTLTTSSAGMNFFVGNHEQANGLYTEVPWLASAQPEDEAEGYRREAMRRTGRELSDLAASRYWFGEALEWIVSNPLDWIGLELRKLAYFFHNEEPPNNVSFYGAREYSPVLRGIGWLRFGVLAALGLPGLFLLGGGRRWWLPRALLLGYLAANLLFFVAGEYRYPIVAALIPAAVWTFYRVAAWFRSHDPIPALRTLTLVVVLVLVTHIPYTTMRVIASSETDYFNWGSVSYAQGDLMNASLLFSAALAERPGWRDAHLQLAFVFRDMGMRDQAQREFDAAGVSEEDLARLRAEEEMAEQWFGTAEMDTMSADALAALAAQFNILNRYNAAYSAASRALEKDSTNFRAGLEQAFAEENRGRVRRAVLLYQRLEHEHRNDPMLAYRIAWCYYVLGEGTKSQKALSRATTKARELPEGPYRDAWLEKLEKAEVELGNY